MNTTCYPQPQRAIATALLRGMTALIIASTAGGVSLGAQPPVAEAPQTTFRSSVDLVSIQASVRDKRGRPLQGLTHADFEIRDNGQPRPIVSLRSDRQSPVSLAVLVDMSGSMAVGAKRMMARQAFETLVSQLRQGEDELALFTFDSALHERQPFTSDLGRMAGALDEFHPFGTTSLYDAVAATARRFADRSASHKAVVVLTDGTDTSSALTAPEVSGLASSIDVPVYIVATVPHLDQIAMQQAASRTARSQGADLRELAEWTGGQLVFASTPGETLAVTSSLVNELRQRYVLAIEAASTFEWRRLEIRVRHPSATVKARSGYFGG